MTTANWVREELLAEAMPVKISYDFQREGDDMVLSVGGLIRRPHVALMRGKSLTLPKGDWQFTHHDELDGDSIADRGAWACTVRIPHGTSGDAHDLADALGRSLADLVA